MVKADGDLIRTIWLDLQSDVYMDICDYIYNHPLIDNKDDDKCMKYGMKLTSGVMKYLHRQINKIFDEELDYERKR